jgi:hypothetical protein
MVSTMVLTIGCICLAPTHAFSTPATERPVSSGEKFLIGQRQNDFAGKPRVLGYLNSALLPEISGAVSVKVSGSERVALNGDLTEQGWWVLNDGGNPSAVLRLTPTGAVTHQVSVAGYRNKDWEDLAQFEWQGKSYWLIADTGDNDAVRREVGLLVVTVPSIESVSDWGKAAVDEEAAHAGFRDQGFVSVRPLQDTVFQFTFRVCSDATDRYRCGGGCHVWHHPYCHTVI